MRTGFSSNILDGRQTDHDQQKHLYSLRKPLWIVLPLVAFFILIWLAGPDFQFSDGKTWLALHTSLETFSVVVSILIFGIGWHSYSSNRAGNHVLLACAFLAVGLIDFAHMMSFPGMPDFVTPSSTQKAINFWLVSRFLGSVALFLIVLLPWKPFSSPYSRFIIISASLVLVTFIYWIGLFHENYLPVTFIPGVGLTPFKIGAEYAITAIHAVTLVILVIQSRNPQSFDVSNLFVAIALMGVSELCFTLYFSFDDIFNFLGHIYKILAYIFLYRAVFLNNVQDPYRRLLLAREELQASEEWLLTTLKSIGDAVIATDINGRVTFINPIAENLTGWSLEEALGKEIKEVFPIVNQETRQEVEIPVTRVLREGIIVGLANHTILIAKDGTEIPIDDSAAPIREEKGSIIGVVLVFRDVTERYQADARQRQLVAILEATSDFVATADAEGRVKYYNRAARNMLGIGEDEDISSIVIPDTHPEWANRLLLNEALPAAASEGLWVGETALLSRDGHEIPVSQVILSHVSSTGAVNYFSTIARDISDIKKTEEKERLAAKVFENITEGVMITDASAAILYVNKAFIEITGYSEDDVIGQNPRILSSGQHDADFYVQLWTVLLETGRWKGEVWDRRKDDTIFLNEITISALKDEQGKILHYVSVFNDITLRKNMENQIQHQAYHDMLTDLPNRRYFMERLKQAIARSSQDTKMVGVMFLDLDQFKLINDTMGHSMGDTLLKLVAERLMHSVRDNDMVSRQGGDEFIILLEDLSDQREAVKVAGKVLESLSQPFILKGKEYFITTSIGISLYPMDGEEGEILIRNADTAMYRAKDQRDQYQFFTPSMNVSPSERLEFQNELRKALIRKEFFLHYQPRVDVHTEEIIGVEALIRWNHPELGMVSPVKFIPTAEETGLIIPIGEWVLYTACRQNKAWQEAGLPPVRIAVNLSLLQFQQKNLTEMIDKVLREVGLSPHFLELELTESIIMTNPEATIRSLHELREMGIHISLDDFGTGYSSLNYLTRLPLNTLKIDKSFVQNLATNREDKTIVRAVIALAHSLKMKVTIEGVETEEQLDILRSYQCDEIQGYVYSPPMPSEELLELFQTGISESAPDREAIVFRKNGKGC